MRNYLNTNYKKPKLIKIYEYAAGLLELSTNSEFNVKKLIGEILKLCLLLRVVDKTMLQSLIGESEKVDSDIYEVRVDIQGQNSNIKLKTESLEQVNWNGKRKTETLEQVETKHQKLSNQDNPESSISGDAKFLKYTAERDKLDREAIAAKQKLDREAAQEEEECKPGAF